MVMGLKNSAQILQRVMNKALKGILGNGIEVYMDDIIIHSKDEESHNKLLEKLMHKLEIHNLRVNMKKLQFKQKR